jgi:hypothetical protein
MQTVIRAHFNQRQSGDADRASCPIFSRSDILPSRVIATHTCPVALRERGGRFVFGSVKMKQRPADYVDRIHGDAEGLHLLIPDHHANGLRSYLDQMHLSFVALPSVSGETKLDFDPMVGFAELRAALLRYTHISRNGC